MSTYAVNVDIASIHIPLTNPCPALLLYTAKQSAKRHRNHWAVKFENIRLLVGSGKTYVLFISEGE